jgi:hypothetical protein
MTGVAMRLCWLFLSCALVAGARAEQGGDAGAQRERIAREREAIEARYRVEQARCATQFVVTPCVDRARSERRRALEPLDRELASLDEMERRRRAAERLVRIEEKARERATRPAPVIRAPRLPKARPAPAPTAAASSPPSSRAEAAPRPGAQAAYERRLRQAQAHREAVEKRNEERAAKKPPAAPLPAPSAPGG